MSVDTMRELFVYELRDVYHAEKQLLKALPKMAKAAKAPELQKAFQEHHAETETHVERLETIFDELETPKRGRHCEAMEGLVEEGQERIQDLPEGELRDAALIVAAQKVEHYEIASYGSLMALANQLRLEGIAKRLGETEAEEKHADEELTQIATKHVNPQAAA
jgi:ferritin-like metal-binding protein YciE